MKPLLLALLFTVMFALSAEGQNKPDTSTSWNNPPKFVLSPYVRQPAYVLFRDRPLSPMIKIDGRDTTDLLLTWLVSLLREYEAECVATLITTEGLYWRDEDGTIYKKQPTFPGFMEFLDAI